MKSLSHERLVEVLNYDPQTGIFKWRTSGVGRRQDLRAGCSRHDGYIQIRIDQRLYLAHRLAWFWCHGYMPSELIDHMNGDPSNNAITNLRPASVAMNQQNRRSTGANNTSGFLGVEVRGHRYVAKIKLNGKRATLGTFGTAEEAHQAYLSAKRQLHEGCTI